MLAKYPYEVLMTAKLSFVLMFNMTNVDGEQLLQISMIPLYQQRWDTSLWQISEQVSMWVVSYGDLEGLE